MLSRSTHASSSGLAIMAWRRLACRKRPTGGSYRHYARPSAGAGANPSIGGSSLMTGAESSPVPTLDEALVLQDPYKRIRFDRPLHMTVYGALQSTRLKTVQASFPKAARISPHVLPCWVVHLICDQTVAVRYFSPNSPDYVDTPQRYQSEIGLTVAAVPVGHWASGVVYPQNVRTIVGSQPIMFRNSTTGVELLPSDSPSVYTSPPGNDPFVPPTWDPNYASRFDLPPPRFTDAEVERIISLQADSYDCWDEVMDPKGIKVFAVPTYKLVYKVEMSNGDIAIYDCQSPMPAINTYKINWSPGQSRPVDHFLSDKIGYWQRFMRPDATLEPHTIRPYPFINVKRIQGLFDTILGAMRRRGPMTPDMWEDERILPALGPMQDGNAQTLFEYTLNTLTDSPDAVEPRFPIAQRSGPSSTNLFTARARATPRAKPRIMTSAAGTTQTPSAGQAPRYGASTIEKRRVYLRERARLARNAVHGAMRSPLGSPDVTTLHVPDPMGYYKELGVTEPDGRFLDEKHAKAVDRLLGEKFREASRVVHPDNLVTGSKEDFQALEAAYSAVETLGQRRKYSG
ncbi:hypothetical protein IAU60_000453 [Kwoniella sp. DSM 27419]